MQRLLRKSRTALFDQTGMDKDTIKTLNLLIVAMMGGMSWAAITGGIAYSGYLKALGTSDFLYGLLMALAPLLSSLQFAASYLLERRLPRKKTFIITGLIQRLVWIPIGLVPFVIPMQAATLRIWIVALLVTVSAGMTPLMNVTFYSICADVVPIRIRSRYFSVRMRIAMVAALAIGLLVGRLLDTLPGFTGYTAAFTIAGVVGGTDILCFLFMKIPPMRREQTPDSMVRMLKSVVRDKNYMHLAVFGALWYFGVFLSSPFFNVYMLQNMQMSKTDIILLAQVASNLFAILAVTRWGRAFERFGTRPVLILNTLLGCTIPLLWAFVEPGMLWLVFAINAISGMQWAAFEVGAQNLFMGQAPERNRTMYIAVYFIGTQLLGSALGSAVGGWLLDNPLTAAEAMNLTFGWMTPTRYHYLFLLSFLFRLLAVGALPRVREVGSSTLREVTGALIKRVAHPRAGKTMNL